MPGAQDGPGHRHGTGDRWQVRYRDDNGTQRARNFAKKTGTDPDKSADAFDAKVKTQLDDGSYVDPASSNVTFKAFAEDWRKARPTGRRRQATWSGGCGCTCTRRSGSGRYGNWASGRA